MPAAPSLTEQTWGVADRKAMERAENERVGLLALRASQLDFFLMRIAFSDRGNSPPRSNSMMTSCYITSGLDTLILALSDPQNGSSWFADTSRKEARGTYEFAELGSTVREGHFGGERNLSL